MTPKNTNAFETIPVSAIAESTTNPRKTYDDKALLELTNSIKEKGIIVPLIARPHPKPKNGSKYELVAGSRRLRAAIAAGLPEVPIIVRDYSNEQMLEVQIVENLQREDVHPLQESDGFHALLKLPNYTPEILAQKIGHDIGYVYKRLAFGSLIKECRESFETNEINIGHAILLARLPADKQKFAFEELLFEDDENGRFVPGKGWMQRSKGEPRPVVRVAHLDDLIQSEIYLDLSTAPWKKDDAELLPKAGPCTTCPKRTGANAELFDEIKKGDMCLDRECFRAKADATLIQIEDKAKAAGAPLVRISVIWNPAKELQALRQSDYTLIQPKQKKCPSAVAAIYVDGRERGTMAVICTDGSCPVHHPHSAGTGSQPSGGKKDFWTLKAEKLEANIKVAVRRAIVSDILDSTFGIDKGAYAKSDWGYHFTHAQAQLLALALLPHSTPPELLDGLKIPSMPTGLNGMDVTKELEKLIMAPKGSPACSDLPKIMTALALHEWVKEFEPYHDRKLELAIQAFGVDQKKIATEVGTAMRADFKTKRLRRRFGRFLFDDSLLGERLGTKAAKKAPAKKAPAKKKK